MTRSNDPHNNCTLFLLLFITTHFFFGGNNNVYANFQVMEAEKQKAESGTLHQEKTQIFHAAESKVI